MMICGGCGHVFEEEERAGGKMIFPGTEIEPPEYEDYVCPECGCDAITEASKCAVCGKYYLGEDAQDLCPECRNKVAEAIDALAMEISTGDYQEAREAILTYIAEVMSW